MSRYSVGEDGCLQVHGQAVAETYWPDAAPTLVNGCFRTSDLVEITEGLFIYAVVRETRINVAGRKLSPETIETALLSHPDVSDCPRIRALPARMPNAPRSSWRASPAGHH